MKLMRLLMLLVLVLTVVLAGCPTTNGGAGANAPSSGQGSIGTEGAY